MIACMSAPEHDFGEDATVSGDVLRGYTASEAIDQHEPVAISGNYEVELAGEDDAFIGVAGYSVASGENPAILSEGCEARVEVSEAIDAGDELVVDDVNTFRQAVDADDEVGVAIANEDISSGEVGEVVITGQKGNKA